MPKRKTRSRKMCLTQQDAENEYKRPRRDRNGQTGESHKEEGSSQPSASDESMEMLNKREDRLRGDLTTVRSALKESNRKDSDIV